MNRRFKQPFQYSHVCSSNIMTMLLILISATAYVPAMASSVNSANQNTPKTLADFFLPVPIKNSLTDSGIWGAKEVLPRDIHNGLEDPDISDWAYWDGQILKDDDGRYHMYASRWHQSHRHSKGWKTASKAIHATSNDLLGPYIDQGETWPNWNEGSGHNVIGLRLADGRYAMITSEVTPGNVFVSSSPSGPWQYLGDFKIDYNGFYEGLARYDELDLGALKAGSTGYMANATVIQRHDGRYMIIARHCAPMISESGILGPYKIMADKAWKGVEGIPQYKNEDPTVWYSDGLYHIVVNHHFGGDRSFHLTSEDGIHNWSNRGIAFNKRKGIFNYENGIENNWYTVQRPTVFIENEHVKAFNFSVIDVHKGQDLGNDHHASKVVVVPFDGIAFNTHIRSIVEKEIAIADALSPPSPWQSTEIGNKQPNGNTGYQEHFDTIRLKAYGKGIADKKDQLRYVYQAVSGDVSISTLVLSQDEDATQSGLMFRKSLDDNAALLLSSLSNKHGLQIQKRARKGKKSNTKTVKEIKAPYWLRMEKRGNQVSTYISSSNQLNWVKVNEENIELGKSFFIGAAASSGATNLASLARFKNLSAHTWGKPIKEGIISHSFPDVISAQPIVNFDIEYENTQPLEVFVELQNVSTYKKHPILRKRMQLKGNMNLSYDFGEKIKRGDQYWLSLKLIPIHGHETQAIQQYFKKVRVE